MSISENFIESLMKVLSSIRSEHCYSTAELRAIKKFNSLFKKVIVFPSNKTFSGSNSTTANTKYIRTAIPKDLCQPIISSFTKNCDDLGHDSKEIQMAEEYQLSTQVDNEYEFQEDILLKQLMKKSFMDHFLQKYKYTKGKQQFHHYCPERNIYQEISECRICRITYPILFPDKNFRKQNTTAENKENAESKMKKKPKSSSLIETNDNDESQHEKVKTNCKKAKKNKNFLSTKEDAEALITVNKNNFGILLPSSRNKNYFKIKSAPHIQQTHYTNEQINPESSNSLVVFGCEESLLDIQMAIDTIIRYLRHVVDAQKIFGCDLIESVRSICEEMVNNCKICCEDEEIKTGVLNRNELEPELEDTYKKKIGKMREYEQEADKEKRIQALIEKIKYKTKCLCANRFQPSENVEKHDQKLEKNAHSQDIMDFPDAKMTAGETDRKIEITSSFGEIDKERRELGKLNIKSKCFCKDLKEVIPEKYHPIDYDKKKEREKKLEELLKVIILKRKCLCREELGEHPHWEVTNLSEGVNEKSSYTSIESSDISLEQMRRRYSNMSGSKKSLRRVSFLDKISQTEVTRSHSVTAIKEEDTPKLDIKTSTISIKTVISSIEVPETYNIDEPSRMSRTGQKTMISEETYTPSAYKHDVSVTSNPEDIIQADTFDTVKVKNRNDDIFYQDRSEINKREEGNPSSDEEFYDTSEEKMGNFEDPSRFTSVDVIFEEDAKYADEAQEDLGNEKLEDVEEEISLSEEFPDSRLGKPKLLSESASEKAEAKNIEIDQCIDSEIYSENYDEIIAKFVDRIRRDSLQKYLKVLKRVRLMSDTNNSKATTEDQTDVLSTSTTKGSDSDIKESIHHGSYNVVGLKNEDETNLHALYRDSVSKQGEKKISDHKMKNEKLYGEFIQKQKHENISHERFNSQERKVSDSRFGSQGKSNIFSEEMHDKSNKNYEQFEDSTRDNKLSDDSTSSQKKYEKFSHTKKPGASQNQNEKPSHVDTISQKYSGKIFDSSEIKLLDRKSNLSESFGKDYGKKLTTKEKMTKSPEFKERISKSEPDLRKASRTISRNYAYNLIETEKKDDSKEHRDKPQDAKLFVIKKRTLQNISNKMNMRKKENGGERVTKKVEGKKIEKFRKEKQKIIESKPQTDKKYREKFSDFETYGRDDKSLEKKDLKLTSIAKQKPSVKSRTTKDKKDYKGKTKVAEKDGATEYVHITKAPRLKEQKRISAEWQSKLKEDGEKIKQKAAEHNQKPKDKNDYPFKKIPRKIIDIKESDETPSTLGVPHFTDEKKGKYLGISKSTDTFLDESLKLQKKTRIVRAYDSSVLEQTDDDFILKKFARTRLPNSFYHDIERRMADDKKTISCETLDDLFGLGYLLGGENSRYSNGKLLMSEEKQNRITYKGDKDKEQELSQTIFNVPSAKNPTLKRESKNKINCIRERLKQQKDICDEMKTETSVQRHFSNMWQCKGRCNCGSSKPSAILSSIEEKLESQKTFTNDGKTKVQTKNKYFTERKNKDQTDEKNKEIRSKTKIRSIKINKDTSEVIESKQKIDEDPPIEKKPHINKKTDSLARLKIISRIPWKQTTCEDRKSNLEQQKASRENIYLKEKYGITINKKLEKLNISKPTCENLDEKNDQWKSKEIDEEKNGKRIFSRHWNRLNAGNGKKNESGKNEICTCGKSNKLSLHDESNTNIYDNKNYKHKRSKHIESLAERIVDDVIKESYKIYEKRLQQIGQYQFADNKIKIRSNAKYIEKSVFATDQTLKERKRKKIENLKCLAEKIVDDVIKDSYKIYEKRLQQINQSRDDRMETIPSNVKNIQKPSLAANEVMEKKKRKRSPHIESLAQRIVDDVIKDSNKIYEKRLKLTAQNSPKQYTSNMSIQQYKPESWTKDCNNSQQKGNDPSALIFDQNIRKDTSKGMYVTDSKQKYNFIKEKHSMGQVEGTKYVSSFIDSYRPNEIDLKGNLNIRKPYGSQFNTKKQNSDINRLLNYTENEKFNLKSTNNAHLGRNNLGTITKNKIQKYYHRFISHNASKKKEPNPNRKIQLKDTKSQFDEKKEIISEISSEFVTDALKGYVNNIIHEKFNINEYDANEKKIKLYLKKMRPRILSDDGINITKLAKYADILEDICLDKAIEMEEFLTESTPFIKKKPKVSSDNSCNKSSKYKLCELEDNWSSSSLKTSIKSLDSRSKFCKDKYLENRSTPRNLKSFTPISETVDRKLFEQNKETNNEDTATRQILSKTEEIVLLEGTEHSPISKTCFCNENQSKRINSNKNICSCPGYTSLTENKNGTLKIGHLESSDSINTNLKISPIENENLKKLMEKFKRKHTEHGKRCEVPSTSSENIKDLKKIAEYNPIHELLSNVRGSTLKLTESSMSSTFFSACDFLQKENSCFSPENPLEWQNIEQEEECAKVYSSKAIESFTRTISEQNKLNKYETLNPHSSLRFDKGNFKCRGKSVQCFSERNKEKNEKSYSATVAFKRKCVSEKCVRFHDENILTNTTNSLNLHNKYNPCSYKKENFYKLNTNIFICSGSNSLPKCNMKISTPECSFSGSAKNEKNIDYNINKTKSSMSSQYNEFIANDVHSKNKRTLSDFPWTMKQRSKNNSSSSLLNCGNDHSSIHNFNSRIIKIIVKEKDRLPKMDIESMILEYGRNTSLMNIQKTSCESIGKKYENIISRISFKPIENEDNFLMKSIFSLNISRSFTFDEKSFNTLLNILTKSEETILMSKDDSIELNQTYRYGYQFNDEQLAAIQDISIDSKSENTNNKNTFHNSTAEKISRLKCLEYSKKVAKRRRELFDYYEKQRARKWRKFRKFGNEINSPIKKKQPVNETSYVDAVFSSDAEKFFFLHKSSSFHSISSIDKTTTVLDDCEEVLSSRIEIKDNKLTSNIHELSLSHNAITFIAKEGHSKKTITSNKIFTKDTYQPYGRDISLYTADVDLYAEENTTAFSLKERKPKFTCKKATEKMVNWIKSFGMNSKREELVKKKSNEALWNAEVNLMKQRKVLRSKLRYPKTKTSKLYLHKRNYSQIMEETKEISKATTIDPVLIEIPSSEIIEPEYDNEEENSSEIEEEEDEEEKDAPKKDKRLLVLSEDSMILFDRKKVYDHLQKCGKLYYTIYLNEKDDWDHVSIRSAESVEHRVECEDRPFFATYDLGPNDVRVHVTKDVFEEKKKEAIFRNENYVECQNSKVKLSLMRGKRYFTDLDPTKAKIIEIDCTNQFSEIKICYKKTERSEECVCEYPQVCKAVQLESSELSSLDIDKEDKSQDTQELLQNSQGPNQFEEEELQCEKCDCRSDQETCDNYEKCFDNDICASKRTLNFNEYSEEIRTVEFCRVPQGFGFFRREYDKESEKYQSNGKKYAFLKKPPRDYFSKNIKRRYRNSKKKTENHSMW